MTNEELKHNSRLLVKGGVVNTEMETRTYWFTADNELDYSASMSASTTVTVSELPSNTICIYFMVRMNDTNDEAQLSTKRKSTDTSYQYWAGGVNNASGNNYLNTSGYILTNGNSFYVGTLKDTLVDFLILGYTVKE